MQGRGSGVNFALPAGEQQPQGGIIQLAGPAATPSDSLPGSFHVASLGVSSHVNMRRLLTPVLNQSVDQCCVQWQ